jgi:FAD binding domain-containing protein/berberine-like enzyme
MTTSAGVTSPLQGKSVLEGQPGWDDARRAWQLTVDQRPAAIVYPESAQDVVDAIGFARERGLRVAAQGTGHNAAPLGPLHDTLLLKTERMRGVTVDAHARVARAGAGALSLEVVQAAAAHGLAMPAGTSPDVGVVGYALGGGIGMLSRRYGLAANSVRAIELVTADGRLVRADAEREPELFWAVRGGGGSFGVVTAIEFELFSLAEAYAGLLWYPVERAGEVLHAWRELTQAAPPDALATIGRFLNFPAIPDVPEPVRGSSFVIVDVYHSGDRAQADDLLAPLRALGPANDTIGTVSMPELSRVHMDAEQPVPAVGDGLMLAELPSDALDAFIDVAGAEAGRRLTVIELRHLDGELGRAHPGNGALASIPGKYALIAGGFAPVPELVSALRGQVEAIAQALTPWAAPYMYLNFADTRRDPATLWEEQAYRRLRRVKSAVDPGDLIRSNHPIPPAR